MASNPPAVMIMSGSPHSQQPFSVMHRALYANIVGEESLTNFAHGCTVKQYDGRDYLVDHVTRLARPFDVFPTQIVITEEQLSAQQHHLDDLKLRLDGMRPLVRELENEVKEAHIYENKLFVEAKAVKDSVKKTPTYIATTIPSSEVHLTSLIAQILRIGSHANISHLSSGDLKMLKQKAPKLAAFYFRYKNGTIQWGKPLYPVKPAAGKR